MRGQATLIVLTMIMMLIMGMWVTMCCLLTMTTMPMIMMLMISLMMLTLMIWHTANFYMYDLARSVPQLREVDTHCYGLRPGSQDGACLTGSGRAWRCKLFGCPDPQCLSSLGHSCSFLLDQASSAGCAESREAFFVQDDLR